MLVRSGIRLFKYWFSVTREEQRRRFLARETDPLKQWKLSPIDKASLDKWDDYTEAKEAMFFYTDTADAPWTIVKSDDKKRARLNCMQHFLVAAALSQQGPSRRRRPRPADRRLVVARDRRRASTSSTRRCIRPSGARADFPPRWWIKPNDSQPKPSGRYGGISAVRKTTPWTTVMRRLRKWQ